MGHHETEAVAAQRTMSGSLYYRYNSLLSLCDSYWACHELRKADTEHKRVPPASRPPVAVARPNERVTDWYPGHGLELDTLVPGTQFWRRQRGTAADITCSH